MKDDLTDVLSAHDDVVRIERLTHHIARIREGMDDMRQTLNKLAEAVAKLAVIEERQNQDRHAMERAFNAIAELHKKHDAAVDRVMATVERIEVRVAELERAESLNRQARYWLFGAIGTGAAAMFYAVARAIGLAK